MLSLIHRCTKLHLIAVVIATILFLPRFAEAQSYSITYLGTLDSGVSWAYDINNVGQAVGFVSLADGSYHAFIWQNGAMTDLGSLGGGATLAQAINRSGLVVGSSDLAGGLGSDAFLWQSGVMTDLGTLGTGFSSAYGINASGAVVGYSGPADGGGHHGFLWQNGVMSDLGTLGGVYSSGLGINDSGVIVGLAYTADEQEHACIWQNGVISDLGTLGGDFSSATGINNSGQIVGASNLAAGGFDAFIWQNGIMTDLGSLGGNETSALRINSSGQVVGYSFTAGGTQHACLWQNGVIIDLNSLIPANSGWVLNRANGINDSGQIVGQGNQGAFLLTPAPTANPQTVAVDLGTPTKFKLTGTDHNSPPLPLTFAIANQPGNGTLGGFNTTTGAVTYTPNINFLGNDSFTFTVSNGTVTSTAATVTLKVAAGAPIAKAQTVPVAHGAAAKITLTGTDPNTPPLALTFAIASAPAHGTLGPLNAATGTVTYTPTAAYQGQDSFTFTASNKFAKSLPATITLNVAAGTPVAHAQIVTVAHNIAKAIILTGTDPDTPPLILVFAISTGPTHGALSGLNTSTGAVTYTPNNNFQGADTFTFTVNNGSVTSTAAAITLNVAGGTPTAKAQTVNVAHNTTFAITLTGADPDIPPLPLTFAIAAQPTHGSVGILNTTTGAVTYTPTLNYQGADSFTFTVSNGTHTSPPATVTLKVAPGTPTANAQMVTVPFNTATKITLTGTDPDVPALKLTFAVASVPAHGALSGLNAATGAVTFTPNKNFHGADSFTFTVSNGSFTSAAAAVTINVKAGTPTANPQTVAVAHNTAATVTLTGTDPDSPALPLTFAIGASPTHGALTGLNTTTGAVTYTPNANFQGTDTFTFTVNNGTNTSAAAKVTLNVAPGTPTANAQTVTVALNTPTMITLTGSDPDVPALKLTFAIATLPAHGVLGNLNTATGVVTYTPGAGINGARRFEGVDSFTFTVSNGTNTSAPATVTLNVGNVLTH